MFKENVEVENAEVMENFNYHRFGKRGGKDAALWEVSQIYECKFCGSTCRWTSEGLEYFASSHYFRPVDSIWDCKTKLLNQWPSDSLKPIFLYFCKITNSFLAMTVVKAEYRNRLSVHVDKRVCSWNSQLIENWQKRPEIDCLHPKFIRSRE